MHCIQTMNALYSHRQTMSNLANVYTLRDIRTLSRRNWETVQLHIALRSRSKFYVQVNFRSIWTMRIESCKARILFCPLSVPAATCIDYSATNTRDVAKPYNESQCSNIYGPFIPLCLSVLTRRDATKHYPFCIRLFLYFLLKLNSNTCTEYSTSGEFFKVDTFFSKTIWTNLTNDLDK